jgi:hypothetical protein
MKVQHGSALQAETLIVEGERVHKVLRNEGYAAGDTVELTLRDQHSMEESTRTVQKDAPFMTEQGLDMDLGDSGRLKVELAGHDGVKGGWVYRWYAFDGTGRQLGTVADLHSGPRQPTNNKKAMSTLLSFIAASGEAYDSWMRGTVSDNFDLFPPSMRKWTSEIAEEAAAVQVALDPGSLGLT